MIQELTHDSVQRRIEAAPQDLYDLIADVTRTPQLSPEVVACEWIDGATGPAVGARFRATNHAGRGPDWHNTPVITVADRGREFAFTRTEKHAGTIEWRYRLTPDGTGTIVTESYEVIRPVTRFGWFIIGVIYGNNDRRADLHRGMTHTLRRLAALAEGAPANPVGQGGESRAHDSATGTGPPRP